MEKNIITCRTVKFLKDRGQKTINDNAGSNGKKKSSNDNNLQSKLKLFDIDTSNTANEEQSHAGNSNSISDT